MKTLTPLIAATVLVLLPLEASAQQWGNAKVGNETTPGLTITIGDSEDSLRMKMLNVCTTTLFMAFSDQKGMGYVLAAPHDPYDGSMTRLDTLIPGNINGLAGNFGFVFNLSISTADSLSGGFYSYDYSSPPIREGVEKREFDSIETVFGRGDQDWLLLSDGDSSTLLKVNYVNNAVNVIDTISLPVNRLLGLYGGNSEPLDYYVLGKSAIGRYVLARVSLYNSQKTQAVFDSIPGSPLYGRILTDRALILSHDSIGVYTTMYNLADDSIFYDTIAGVSGSDLLDVAEWDPFAKTIALLVRAEDTSKPQLRGRVLVYHLDPIALEDSWEVNVNATKLYTALHNYYQYRYLQFTDDSTQQILLGMFEQDPGSLMPDPILLSSNPDVVRPVSVCFVGIDEGQSPPLEARVFPNPSRQECHVEIKNVPCDRDHYLELFDMNGRKVYEATFQSKCTVTIPVRGLQAGVYLLKMEIAGRTYTHKIVKQ